MNQLEHTISSLEVARMVGRAHKEVLRDIRNIIEQLGGERKIAPTYFIESEYLDVQGKTQPCFNLTKKGCELFGTRMTGAKGTQFAVKYIERFNEMEQRFNEMEQRIKQEAQPQSSLELALRAALKHEQDIKGIRSDVDYLKGSMRIDSLQEQEIQQEANKSVVQALGGKESNAYKQIRNKAFSAFWKEFKGYFKVPRYGDIPKVKHDEALRFIQIWRPSASLQMEIDACNSQMSF